jgi:hypothetical protein
VVFAATVDVSPKKIDAPGNALTLFRVINSICWLRHVKKGYITSAT